MFRFFCGLDEDDDDIDDDDDDDIYIMMKCVYVTKVIISHRAEKSA